MRKLTLFLALKHIRRRALQSALTVLGVAVGVMVLITALSLTNGFIDELISSTLRATPHVTLRPLGAMTIANDSALLTRLQNHPEVAAAAPFIETQALIARRADRSQGISGRQGYTQILGIDPALEQNVLDLGVLAREAEALSRGEGIILGDSLAIRSLGVFPGDEVLINNISGKRAFFDVAGTFRVGNELIDSVVSYTSIPALQAYLSLDDEISGYHVRVNSPQDARRIGLELGDSFGLQAFSWESVFSSLVDQLRLQKALISAVTFLIVLVAAMGIANILILTVAEKTEEIGILRAMGASQRQILSIFTLEGLILGGLGTLLGVLLGLAISVYFTLKPFPLPGDLYFITQLPVQLQVFDFIWVCSLSLMTSVVAGFIPARRASGLNPVDILK